MKKELDDLKKDYNNYLLSHNYVKNSSVNITSGIDSSVVLIGSAISVFKTKLLNCQINKNGEFLFQPAIRTRGIKKLLIPEQLEWYSYFDATGILVNYDLLEKLVYDVVEFLNKCFCVDYSNIMIRALNSDIDLLKSLKNIDSNIKIECNSRELNYYRHKYGLQDLEIYGRNFNIAIKHCNSSEYKDIGNIIVIESPYKKYGVECAIGINALIMRKFNLQNSIEASTIVDIYHPLDDTDYKFLDCLMVVSHLAHENINLINSRSPQYIYRKYLNALKYWADQKNISNEELLDLINRYIQIEYNKSDTEQINKTVGKLLIKRRFTNE